MAALPTLCLTIIGFACVTRANICLSTRKYVKNNIVFDCMQGLEPQVVGCSPSIRLKRVIPIGQYFTTRSFRYYCQQEDDEVIWKAVGCVGFNGKVLNIGGKQEDTNGSTVECVKDKNNRVQRIIYGPESESRSQNSQNIEVRGHFVYKTELFGDLKYSVPIGCAFEDSAGAYISFGQTADKNGFRFLCTRTATDVKLSCIGCLDGNTLLGNGQIWGTENATYRCDVSGDSCKKAFVSWILSTDPETPEGCLLPDGGIITKGEIYFNSGLKFTCIYTPDAEYILLPAGCHVPGEEAVPSGKITYISGQTFICDAGSVIQKHTMAKV